MQFSWASLSHPATMEVKKLCIYCANGESIYFSVSYYASKLEQLITKLIELTKPIDSYLSCEETGKTKGYLSSSNREAFYAGQKNGYKRCSRQYEIKLRRQAENNFMKAVYYENGELKMRQSYSFDTNMSAAAIKLYPRKCNLSFYPYSFSMFAYTSDPNTWNTELFDIIGDRSFLYLYRTLPFL